MTSIISSDSAETASPTGRERRATVRLNILWNRLRRGKAMPSMNDLNPDNLPVSWTQCFILPLQDGEPEMFDFVGSALASISGGDLTGRAVTEISDNTALARTLNAVPAVVASGAPQIVEGQASDTDGGYLLFRAILMPFGSDRRSTDTLVGAITYKRVDS